jgi:ferrous iron transport protein B
MGILMAEGEVDENSDSMRAQLKKYYTPLQAFCVMLFCLLSIPCLATLAIIKRELNSWKMALLEGAGMFALAYTAAFIVYQAGTLLNIGTKFLS